PHSPWLNFGSKPFPQHFSFQLHFDDPRLPQNDRSSIIGDRNLLEKLREKVNEYINNYLKINNIFDECLACELPSANQEEFISITRDSTYRHRLFYHSLFPKEEIIEIVLTNTQLLDFVNALSAYYLDSSKKLINQEDSISSNLGLSITITALVFLIGGSIWWRYERQVTTNTITQDLNQQAIKPNVEPVIPPSKLDPSTLPSIITPEVPEDLKKRNPLLPPSPVSAPPQGNETNTVNNNILNHNSPTQRAEMVIAPPPLAPSISNLPPSSVMMVNENPPNLMGGIQPSIQPVTPSFQPTTIIHSSSPAAPTPIPTPEYPSRLSSLPVLQSRNLDKVQNLLPTPQENIPNPIQPGINTLNSVSPSVIENMPDFSQHISKLDSSLEGKKSGAMVSGDVKQYFQNKWQPPENLKQSIEYRLNFNQSGSLTKITPMGQVAIIFLDRTQMPLLGEKMTSSFTDIDQVTVRLILSPNGNVQTFYE
ncbi:DUF4335 domain-containing protein, partial [Geminocystis sp. GBBB08]|uniref:DUF4335 domain-containing protein n=1 Tax=Geminocystis sp. GBBB08 TaxID=2604140 RepID=UPI0027E27E73